jgi:ABC-type arginine/histidine transport system permease subunit
MTRVYYIFDKVSIITIIIGFILGIYLAFNHNSSNVWFDAIPFIIIIAAVMTLPPIIGLLYSGKKYNEKFSWPAIIEAYLLNVAILIVCTAFGIVLGSFYIGNFIAS